MSRSDLSPSVQEYYGVIQRSQRHVYLVALSPLGLVTEEVDVTIVVQRSPNIRSHSYRGGVVYVIAVIVGRIFAVVWHILWVYTADLNHLSTDVLGQPGRNLV